MSKTQSENFSRAAPRVWEEYPFFFLLATLFVFATISCPRLLNDKSDVALFMKRGARRIPVPDKKLPVRPWIKTITLFGFSGPNQSPSRRNLSGVNSFTILATGSILNYLINFFTTQTQRGLFYKFLYLFRPNTGPFFCL